MTTSASRILRRRYIKGDAAKNARIEGYRVNTQIARDIFALRKQADPTQAQLAQRVGTTTSVICQLEDADYEGHSLSMLRRVAAALGSEVQVVFAPESERVPVVDELTASKNVASVQ